MLCQKFAESWFNGKHRVARRDLRPFCLWHSAYLQFVNSPLAPGFESPKGRPVRIGWDDIELASRICQLEYAHQLSINQGALLRAGLKLRLFITMAKSTLETEEMAFEGYVQDYFAPPQFNRWKQDHPIRGRGGPPDVLSVASACIMLFGGGPAVEKFVWEMPIGKAYWYASTLHYNRGAPLDYMTAREMAIRSFLRAQRAKGLI